MVEDPEADRLYALPLEQFTEARDALADRLRRAGDAEEAARIRRLRKPTTPAWVVNQLARRHRDRVEGLIAASEGVRRAQQDLLHGGDAGGLWGATLAERDAVSALVREGEAILRAAGLGAPRGMLERVADTLSAAASDPRGRTLLRRGALTQEMRRAGFGETFSPETRKTAPRPARDKPEPAPKGRTPAAAVSARQRLEAEREAGRLDREARRLEAEADRAGKEADRVERDAAQARKRAEAADSAARGARATAAEAARDAKEARRRAVRAAHRFEKIAESP